LAPKFARSAITTQGILQKITMNIKKSEFFADFRFQIQKLQKQSLLKSYCQKIDKKLSF